MPGIDGLLDKILAKAEDFGTLTIKTVVGDITTDPKTMKLKIGEGRTDSIFTTIDLIDGDITTLVSAKFLENEYKSIFDFHKEREKEGAAIIDKNIKALKSIYNAVSSISMDNKGKPAEGNEPGGE